MENFITVGAYTINLTQITYIEESEEFGTVLHFAGSQTLQLGDAFRDRFWKEWHERSESKALTYH